MADLSFEKALKQLEKIVEKLEKGEVPLEESLKLYEEGSRLALICQERLSRVEDSLKELVQTEGGGLELKDFSLEED